MMILNNQPLRELTSAGTTRMATVNVSRRMRSVLSVLSMTWMWWPEARAVLLTNSYHRNCFDLVLLSYYEVWYWKTTLKWVSRRVGSRDKAAGIAIDYGLDDWEVGVPVPVRSTIFTSPYRPYVQPRRLSIGYRGKVSEEWSWPTHLQLVTRSRKRPLPHKFHGVVLN
jgi:hypothetical protein